MGCDIHIYPEVYNGSAWVPAEPFVLSKLWWYDRILDEMEFEYDSVEYRVEDEKFKAMSNDDAIKEYGDNPMVCWSHPFDQDHGSRNYTWFAILANVRNYDRKQLIPISKPKGLPANISVRVANLAECDCVDIHSHSWYTLKELLDYDWSKIIKQSGCVGKKQFMEFYAGKNPDSWCEVTNADRWDSISNRKMWHMCLGIFNGLDPEKNHTTVIDWSLTRREMIGERYFDEFFDKLRSYGDPENVRVVFWFDN